MNIKNQLNMINNDTLMQASSMFLSPTVIYLHIVLNNNNNNNNNTKINK